MGGKISFLNLSEIRYRAAIGLGVRRPDFVGVPSNNIVVKNNYLMNCTNGIETFFNSSNNSIINNIIWVPEPSIRFGALWYNGRTGIYFYGGSGNLAENNTILNYEKGIYIRINSNSTVRGNRVYNARVGIQVESFNVKGTVYVKHNILKTKYGIFNSGVFSEGIFLIYAHNTVVLDNNLSGFTLGIEISYDGDNNTIAGNYVFNSTLSGIAVGPQSIGRVFYGNLIANNTLKLSGDPALGLYGWVAVGVFLYESDFTVIENNTVLDTYGVGIGLWNSNNTIIKGNKITNTTKIPGASVPGIPAEGSISLVNTKNNTITGNLIIKSDTALVLNATNFSDVRSNRIYDSEYGLKIINSNHDKIYNNLFNTTYYVNFSGSYNFIFFNTTKTRGVNIVGGPFIGGNFWAKPDGSGFSETCTADADKDGICDVTYEIYPQEIDYLPLTCPPELPDLTVTSVSLNLVDPKKLEYDIEVSVENAGKADASDFEVVVLVDGVQVGSELIPILGAGETRNLAFTWAAPSEGDYTISAIVDPGYPNDSVIESDENNNYFTLNFTVNMSEEGPDVEHGRETLGVLFDLWNIWTVWFFNNYDELPELYEEALKKGIDEATLEEVRELNQSAVELIQDAWRTGDLDWIRAHMWRYLRSPVRWWMAREAYLKEKRAVELLKKALAME
ncbi:NosD domain-containing protein [Thermococcus sp.]